MSKETLVQRLRDFYTSDETHWMVEHDITTEAANRIEELEAQVQALEAKLEDAHGYAMHPDTWA